MVDFSSEGVEAIEKGSDKITVIKEWASLQRGKWFMSEPLELNNNRTDLLLATNILFVPPDIKLFCMKCDRIEPFNVLNGSDLFARVNILNDPVQSKAGVVQIFTLSYLCQSCKAIPEIFLIRREGSKLTLSGRSPMEHVDVPKVIPKIVAHFYSGAIVAHQSGQTLAGIFLLRTLIEQFAYTKSTNPKTADDAIDQYMASLPEDFKARFPSFREIYSLLSVDIHSAKGSPDVFEDSRAKIIKHYEARQLFGIQ